MLIIEKDVFIGRPQQEVFDFAANPANWPEYENPVESTEVTSEGPLQVGSTVHIISRLFGRRMNSDAGITVWDPPNRYGRKALNMPFTAELTMDFEPRADATQVNAVWQGEFRGLLGMVEGMMRGLLARAMAKDLSALKTAMETNSSAEDGA